MSTEPPRSRCTVRVRFCDTDLMGIVHHAKYLEYFEAGRVSYMRKRGLDYAAWAARGIHLPVVEVAIRYRRPTRFDDVIVVETSLLDASRATVRFGYRLLRGAEETLVTEGSTLLCCTGDDGAPRRVPEDLLGLLRGAETRPDADGHG